MAIPRARAKGPWHQTHAQYLREVWEVRKYFPQFKFRKNHRVAVEGNLVSRSGTRYQLLMEYPNSYPRSEPKIKIISPHIKHSMHQYRGKWLCLFNPVDGSWKPGKTTGATILAWAAKWIFCSEIYELTGVWPGEEALHSGPKEATAAPFRRIQVDVGRNDPCPCGSGKKYKKCCFEV